jgi:hypothetical protein
MNRASYGAVMSKLGQDELCDIYIPMLILDVRYKVLNLMNAIEVALRAARRLKIAAQMLVEAVIEHKLAESELRHAQCALMEGDTLDDRKVLTRLTNKGIDAEGSPSLFPDLDTLYTAIDEAERALTDGETSG